MRDPSQNHPILSKTTGHKPWERMIPCAKTMGVRNTMSTKYTILTGYIKYNHKKTRNKSSTVFPTSYNVRVSTHHGDHALGRRGVGNNIKVK